jgi:hypothetical protein
MDASINYNLGFAIVDASSHLARDNALNLQLPDSRMPPGSTMALVPMSA